jgi:uncharacterized protein YjbJ (UPF0337 family)
MSEPKLEDTVKGMGQEIAGKLKELAGGLIEDVDLERAGVEQQVEGEVRRTLGAEDDRSARNA